MPARLTVGFFRIRAGQGEAEGGKVQPWQGGAWRDPVAGHRI